MNADIFLDDCYTDRRGMTGSETSIVEIAKSLSKEHHVGLVGKFACANGMWGDVHVGSSLLNESWDIAIAWIDPTTLRNVDAKLKVFNQQVNDFHYCQGWESYIDVITSPSNNHRDNLSKQTQFDKSKWIVCPNGFNENVYKFHNGVRPNKQLVYASSPDRGLHWLLEMMPRIRQEVSDVELHIFYNWKNFYESQKHNENEIACRLRYCHSMMERMKGFVHHHQSTSKLELSNWLSSSRVLAYPCDPVNYTEGFSVTTLEAAASGCVPVICGSDALQEIYGPHVPTVSKAPYKSNKEEYYRNLKTMLTNDESYVDAQIKSHSMVDDYRWDKISEKLINDLNSYFVLKL